jgi:EpsI family protein
MNYKKSVVVIILISLAILISYSSPRAKYKGTGFITDLKVPKTISEWTGRDISEIVFESEDPQAFDFISESLAHQYANKAGQNLLFIILDAANFHHPKVCFTEAGFKIRELPDTTFSLPNRTLKAHTLFTEQGRDTYLSFYWIVIDKNVVHEWIEQKFKQLFFSLFGKQRVGLMVRIDIPVKEDEIGDAMLIAKQFVGDLDSSLNSEQFDYILGKE